MRRSLSIAAAVVTVTAAAGAVGWGVSGANASTTTNSSLLEDYSYPNADAVAQQYPGLQVFKGDGHIVFKGECTAAQAAGMLSVESYITPSADIRFCFQVLSSTSGDLKLKVPQASYVDGDSTHKILAIVQPDSGADQVKTNVALTGFTPVAIGTGDSNSGAVVELRVGWDPSLPTP